MPASIYNKYRRFFRHPNKFLAQSALSCYHRFQISGFWDKPYLKEHINRFS